LRNQSDRTLETIESVNVGAESGLGSNNVRPVATRRATIPSLLLSPGEQAAFAVVSGLKPRPSSSQERRTFTVTELSLDTNDAKTDLASQHLRRRSRSAGSMLRDAINQDQLAGEAGRRPSVTERRRSDEIRFWRQSFRAVDADDLKVKEEMGEDSETEYDGERDGDKENRPPASLMAGQSIMDNVEPEEMDDGAQDFHDFKNQGFYFGSPALPGPVEDDETPVTDGVQKRTSLEQRVRELELKFFDLQTLVHRTSGSQHLPNTDLRSSTRRQKRSSPPPLRRNDPSSVYSGDRDRHYSNHHDEPELCQSSPSLTDTYQSTVNTLDLDSPSNSSHNVTLSPMPKSQVYSGEPRIVSTSDTIRPTQSRGHIRDLSDGESYVTSSQYSGLVAIIKREQRARKKLETKVVALQQQVELLKRKSAQDDFEVRGRLGSFGPSFGGFDSADEAERDGEVFETPTEDKQHMGFLNTENTDGAGIDRTLSLSQLTRKSSMPAIAF
jgi:hypothetical protein